MKPKNSGRRKFLKANLLALAGITIAPRFVLGKGFTPPSDQLTKAIIGVGSMGLNHISFEDTRVVAICDVEKLHIDHALTLLPKKKKVPTATLR